MNITVAIILLGAISIVVALFFAWAVSRIPATQGATSEAHAERLLEISDAIREGAMAFLARQCRYMIVFIIFFSLLIWGFVDTQFYGFPFSAGAFAAGALISILAGYIGMRAATMGNVRTTAAAQRSLGRAFGSRSIPAP